MSIISNLIFKNAKHYVTSKFGYRAEIKTSAGTTSNSHQGTDYGTDGKKIAQYAIEDGYVFAAAKASDGANYVWVIYPRVKLAFLHYHLDSIKTKTGAKVVKGTLLGYTGMTGKATGIHLHLGIRDLAKLSTTQVNNMTWNLLQSCSYVDPEKVAYSEAKTTTKTTTAKTTTSSAVNRASAKAGTEIKLTKEPLYVGAYSTSPSVNAQGTYYFYDNEVINNKRRVTVKKQYVGETPIGLYVTGWIKV